MNRKIALWISGGVLLAGVLLIGILSLVNGYFILAPSLQIVLEGESVQEIAAHSEFADPGATARKGKLDLTEQLVATGTVDPTVPGEYTITYRVTYKGSTCTTQRKVVVKDMDAPQLQLTGDAEMIVSAKSLYQEPGFTATDRCDGDLAEKVTVTETEEGETLTLTYSVADAAGNTASVQRVVTIRDIVPPSISLSGRETMYIRLGREYREPGYTAGDDLDGDITDTVICSGGVDTQTAGTYTVYYQVTDAAGNKAEAARTVRVYQPKTDSSDRVCLTFDDGPSDTVTERVLDILAANDVKATFFILNYGSGDRPLIRRMIDEGHTVGIHGYSHDYATIYANDEAFMQNVYRLRDKLLADFGYNSTVIRFPGGSSNTVSASYNKGIMSRLADRVEKEGFRYFDWNVSSGDAAGNTVESSYIYSNVTQGLRRDRNNVVLMHDTNAKWTTADALQDIIDYAYAEGYVFSPITSSISAVHHGISN